MFSKESGGEKHTIFGIKGGGGINVNSNSTYAKLVPINDYMTDLWYLHLDL